MPHLYTGIDLAAQPRDTAICEIHGTKTGATARVHVGADDEDLLASFSPKTGIDAPFGWPEPFAAAIAAHREHRPWPGRDAPDPHAFRRTLRLRRTDVFVHEQTGITPLSVSSEKIGVAAMRCALILDAAAARGVAVERDGGNGDVCEVYPAAALRRWYADAVPWKGYKGKGLDATRRIIAERLLEDSNVEVDDPDALAASDHALDAFVCALVAAAADRGQTVPPREGAERALAAVEGWIHLPRDGDLPRRFPGFYDGEELVLAL